MNLKNFIKSTAELDPSLILKGDQDQVSFISKILVDSENQIILLTLSLTKPTSPLRLFDLRKQTSSAPSGFKFYLFNPQKQQKTYTFGYYLRDQYLVIK
ncbi:hypothetical protein [Pediococcus stilesii]|uniref:Uncharacterized protein n=1 Tax=Pediococcus stilesii TaxID=331679 RepID=A0A0R2KWW9_9LACO|nr:hypothetical protein [Pediococcus stilesii]KRN94067.1 hypothetical protein IV81_GL001710 [Pediococcus stilesii]